MYKCVHIYSCNVSIDVCVHIYYNIIKIKARQTNNPKSCEAENHIPVRGQAVPPIVRKMSQPDAGTDIRL